MRAGGRLPRPLVGPQMLVQHTKCEVRPAAAFPPNLICGSTRESAGVIFLSPSDKQADKAWEPPDAAARPIISSRPPSAMLSFRDELKEERANLHRSKLVVIREICNEISPAQQWYVMYLGVSSSVETYY